MELVKDITRDELITIKTFVLALKSTCFMCLLFVL